jgi:hypothetical protein
MPEVCEEHGCIVKQMTRVATLVEESVIPHQEEILKVLRGDNGTGGMIGRVTALETSHKEALKVATLAAEGTARIEKRWQRLMWTIVGVFAGGGATGIGVLKGLGWLAGG